MLEMIRNLMNLKHVKNENGASAVEYGLLVAGIAALIVVIVFAFGRVVAGSFSNSCTTIATTAKVSSTC